MKKISMLLYCIVAVSVVGSSMGQGRTRNHDSQQLADSSATIPQTPAQPSCDGGLNRATYAASNNAIYILLGQLIADADRSRFSDRAWKLLDLSGDTTSELPRAPTRITAVKYSKDAPPYAMYSSVAISLDAPLNPKHHYLIAADGLTFNNGCSPASVPIVAVDIPPQPQTALPVPTPAKAASSRGFSEQVANTRDDSNIYLAGDLEGAKHSAATKSIDAKVSLTYVAKQGGHELDLIPLVDLKTSSDIGANADTLDLGMKARLSLSRFWLFQTEGRVEADTLFRNSNGVGAFRFIYNGAVHDLGKKVTVYAEPFAGLEAGRNLNRPINFPDDKGIIRPVMGAVAYLNVFRANKEGTHDAFLSVSADYTRRFLLLPEISYAKDTSGNLLPLGAGTSPKDYLQTKIQYNLSTYFGFALGFDYGYLPPSYLKVDREYSISIVYKTQLKYGKKAK